jgi:co-chaperonin GroES (HSP10)
VADPAVRAIGPWALIRSDRPKDEVTASGLLICKADVRVDDLVEGTGVVVSVGNGHYRSLPNLQNREFSTPVEPGDRVLFKSYLKGAHQLAALNHDGQEYFFIHKQDIIGKLPVGMTVGVQSIATGVRP